MPAPDSDLQDTLDQQRALYGQPLGERFAVVRQAYGISQRTLAATLGLSAPMLSQLANGQRIKIGNPVVYARLVMLERRLGEPDPAAVLEEVRESAPVLTTQVQAVNDPEDATAPPPAEGSTSDFAAAHHRLADAEQWAAVAAAARESGADRLVPLFEEARRAAEGQDPR